MQTDAQGQKLQGKVYVRFVVETDGALTAFKILKGTAPELNAEALRVLQKMPKWEPGYVADKPVRQQYTVPINFVDKTN